MIFYIATSLSRASDHNKVRDLLQQKGFDLTYDWTRHGSVKSVSIERLSEVAHREIQGVIDADFIIVLLPGGFGTHIELGAAIASGKKIFVHSENTEYFTLGDKTVAFYHHESITKICCPLDDLSPLINSIDSYTLMLR